MFKEERVQKEITNLLMKHQPTEGDMEKGTLRNGSPVATRFKER